MIVVLSPPAGEGSRKTSRPLNIATSLESWTSWAERIEGSKNLLYFKQSAGIKFESSRLALLEKEALEHYRLFLKKFKGGAEAAFSDGSRRDRKGADFKVSNAGPLGTRDKDNFKEIQTRWTHGQPGVMEAVYCGQR